MPYNFGVNAVSNLLFHWILRGEANRMHAGFYAKCPLVNTIVTSQKIVVNIRNTQIHNNAFSISWVATWRRTDSDV